MAVTLCIPKISNNTTKYFIKNVFNYHKFGTISKVNIISRGNIKKAFIHFSDWNNNEKSIKVKNILDSNLDIKIMFNNVWFWKCVKV
jgi:hypothetical protein